MRTLISSIEKTHKKFIGGIINRRASSNFRLVWSVLALVFAQAAADRRRTVGSSNNNSSSIASLNASTVLSPSSSYRYTFALSPKSVDNPYFQPAIDGCQSEAAALGSDVRCLVLGTPQQNPSQQADLLRQYIHARAIQGLAISVADPAILDPVINEAVAAGIPVVTFDSDAPDSQRALYIGTDNYELGYELGNVLKQLVPQGGTFAIIGASQPNIIDRQQGILASLKDNINQGVRWVQVPGSPSNSRGDPTRAMMQAELFASSAAASLSSSPYSNSSSSSQLNQQQSSTPLTAIIACSGGAMRSGGWKDFATRYNNLTLISGDAMPDQLQYLNTGMVDGLVGQLPYDMGRIAIEVLFGMAVQGTVYQQKVITTNILEHVRIPINLPPLVVNQNLIGNLRIVAYLLFGILATTALGFAAWMYQNRKVRVFKVAQPMFLIMVAAGVFLMGSTMIPLSFDDPGHVNVKAACMATPWLCFTGFTTTFSALFAKTWRVNRIFQSNQPFRRIEVSSRQVLLPFAFLLSVNWIILALWTAIDPLTYVRMNNPGTDAWGRVLSTYGVCKSNDAVPFVVPLAIINFGIMAVANWQAYEARLIEFEFSESKHIAVAMGSMLQATLLGVPLLLVVRNNPPAYFLVLVFLLFIVGMAILLVIFVPKMVFVEECRDRSEAFQSRVIRESIRISQRAAQAARRSFSKRYSSKRSFSEASCEASRSKWLVKGSDRSWLSMRNLSQDFNSSRPRFGSLVKKDIKTALSELAEEGTNVDCNENEIVFEKEGSRSVTAAGFDKAEVHDALEKHKASVSPPVCWDGPSSSDGFFPETESSGSNEHAPGANDDTKNDLPLDV